MSHQVIPSESPLSRGSSLALLATLAFATLVPVGARASAVTDPVRLRLHLTRDAAMVYAQVSIGSLEGLPMAGQLFIDANGQTIHTMPFSGGGREFPAIWVAKSTAGAVTVTVRFEGQASTSPDGSIGVKTSATAFILGPTPSLLPSHRAPPLGSFTAPTGGRTPSPSAR